MREMNQEQLKSLRAQFPQGTRIQCVKNKDGVPIPTGEKGTLEHIDEVGRFHCDLDDGRRFIAAIDEGGFQVIPSKQTEQYRIQQHNDTWNLTLPEIKLARATVQKSKKRMRKRGDCR